MALGRRGWEGAHTLNPPVIIMIKNIMENCVKCVDEDMCLEFNFPFLNCENKRLYGPIIRFPGRSNSYSNDR